MVHHANNLTSILPDRLHANEGQQRDCGLVPSRHDNTEPCNPPLLPDERHARELMHRSEAQVQEEVTYEANREPTRQVDKQE